MYPRCERAFFASERSVARSRARPPMCKTRAALLTFRVSAENVCSQRFTGFASPPRDANFENLSVPAC